MPKNSIVRNEQTATKSSNKTASKRAPSRAIVAMKLNQDTHNPNCTVHVDGEAMRLPVSMDTARQALAFIDPQNRALWVTMGQALKSAYGDEGLPLFCEWSATIWDYSTLDDDHVKSAYKAFNVDGGVSIGTLIYEAVQRGFDPKAHGATPSTDQEPTPSHAPKSNLNDSEQMKFELFASTMGICQAIEGEAIQFEEYEKGLLRLRVVVLNSRDNEKSRLMRGDVSVLNGIDFVRAVPVFMPWMLDRAEEARLNCEGGESKREPFVCDGGRDYAFAIEYANEFVALDLFVNAFAVTSDWLVENIADMFERLAFEIDECIEFVNQRRERGYFNA